MKIILSRKGFDSGSGGVPSPIMPDGRLISLPIPSRIDPLTYDGVTINGISLGSLVEDLTGGRIERTRRCHLDPDLEAASLPRQLGWSPAFGQIDAAQTHLASQNVTRGDLFLFFGWFRAVEAVGSHWRYIRGAPHLHVIYGWMLIDKVISLVNSTDLEEQLQPFADHPHLHGRDRPSNTLYVAADRLTLPGINCDGGNTFKSVSDRRVLTDICQSNRSNWRLPAWCHPRHGTTLELSRTTRSLGISERWMHAEIGCPRSRICSFFARFGVGFMLAS